MNMIPKCFFNISSLWMYNSYIIHSFKICNCFKCIAGSHHYHSQLKHFHHPPEETQYPLTVTPHFSSAFPWPKATMNLLSVFMDLPFQGISYKWNRTIYGPL